MPAPSIQYRFLLRASTLVILLLVLWWFLLLNPLLFLLRGAVDVVGGALLADRSGDFVSDAPAGAWTFRVARDFTVPPTAPGAAPTQLHSLEFDIARADLIVFTFSLPVFWAVLLAAAGPRRALLPLALGTLLMAALETLLLVAFVQMSAHNVAMQLSGGGSAFERWWLRVAEYLIVNVTPFAAPFAMAILLDRDLRRQLLQWAAPEPVPQNPAASSTRQPASVVKRSR